MKQIQRLNDIIAFNQHNPDILAFIGLGSMDETYRLDAYSDVDFFIIVNPSVKPSSIMMCLGLTSLLSHVGFKKPWMV